MWKEQCLKRSTSNNSVQYLLFEPPQNEFIMWLVVFPFQKIIIKTLVERVKRFIIEKVDIIKDIIESIIRDIIVSIIIDIIVSIVVSMVSK